MYTPAKLYQDLWQSCFQLSLGYRAVMLQQMQRVNEQYWQFLSQRPQMASGWLWLQTAPWLNWQHALQQQWLGRNLLGRLTLEAPFHRIENPARSPAGDRILTELIKLGTPPAVELAPAVLSNKRIRRSRKPGSGDQQG